MNEKTGVALIVADRVRQIIEEGWTPEHDARHGRSELVDAAVCYALAAKSPNPGYTPGLWPWGLEWWKPVKDDGGIRNLVKAGALIAAEIDRLNHD